MYSIQSLVRTFLLKLIGSVCAAAAPLFKQRGLVVRHWVGWALSEKFGNAPCPLLFQRDLQLREEISPISLVHELATVRWMVSAVSVAVLWWFSVDCLINSGCEWYSQQCSGATHCRGKRFYFSKYTLVHLYYIWFKWKLSSFKLTAVWFGLRRGWQHASSSNRHLSQKIPLLWIRLRHLWEIIFTFGISSASRTFFCSCNCRINI